MAKLLETDFFISSDDFFQRKISEAMEKCQTEVTADSQSYLVRLLKFYICVENLYERCEKTGKRKRKTLAETYLQGLKEEGALKTKIFRQLADSTLYISGFFRDSLKKKTVDIKYYIGIGGSAYGILADTSPQHGHIFEEFSFRFEHFVNILSYLSQKMMPSVEEDMTQLLDFDVEEETHSLEELVKKGLLQIQSDCKKQ